MKNITTTLKQATFFGFVGIITLAIDVSITTASFNYLHFPAYLASAVGFLSGFAFSFPMNRHKVFSHSSNDKFPLNTQITMYALLCIFNLMATSIMVEVLVTSDVLAIQYAKIVVTALIAAWNFLLFKFVIFSKKSK